MVYLSYLFFLFFGAILGIMLQKYIFSIFDIILDLYSYKQIQKATEYQLNTQMMSMEFLREYPEANQNNQNYQEYQTNAIGFGVGRDDEDDGYCEDEDRSRIKSKNMIGF